MIGDYQFVISFENAIGKDYVTEKFFQSFVGRYCSGLSGSSQYSGICSGENCFLDICTFDSPEGVAAFYESML